MVEVYADLLVQKLIDLVLVKSPLPLDACAAEVSTGHIEKLVILLVWALNSHFCLLPLTCGICFSSKFHKIQIFLTIICLPILREDIPEGLECNLP